jgi:TetR/AcrR family transcriptional repressor of nem operon
MRISKEQAQHNHDRVVDAASVLFRERGLEGAGVAEVMKAAGLTHGGFYNHFESKEALTLEALDQAFRQMSEERARAPSLEMMLKGYLSEGARRNPGKACPAAGLAGDVSRQPEAVKARFAGGVEEILASLAQRLTDEAGVADSAARTRAVDLLTQMVGAVVLARALPDSTPLGGEILQTTLAACLDEIGD